MMKTAYMAGSLNEHRLYMEPGGGYCMTGTKWQSHVGAYLATVENGQESMPPNFGQESMLL